MISSSQRSQRWFCLCRFSAADERPEQVFSARLQHWATHESSRVHLFPFLDKKVTTALDSIFLLWPFCQDSLLRIFIALWWWKIHKCQCSIVVRCPLGWMIQESWTLACMLFFCTQVPSLVGRGPSPGLFIWGGATFTEGGHRTHSA